MRYLGGAAFLALRTIGRQWRRYLLMALTVAAGLAVYFVGASLTAMGRDELVSRKPLDLPAPVVARVSHLFRPTIGWRQTPERRIPIFGEAIPVTDPGVVSRLRPDDGTPVRHAEPGLALDALTATGAVKILFLVPGGEAMASLEFMAGRPPSEPLEVALPEELAAHAGLEVGDTFHATVNYPWSAKASRSFRISGLFRPRSFLTDGPVAAYVGGETTYGPLEGVALLTGRRDPTKLAVAEDQGGPDADPYYANLLFLYPSQGATVAAVESWLNRVVPPLGFWSTATPRLLSGRMARDVVAPVTGVMLLVFMFTGAGVFATALLSFLERRRELAVYKAIGLDARALASVLWLEMVVVWLLALVAGVLLAELMSGLTATTRAGEVLVRLAATVLGLDVDLWSGRPVALDPAAVLAGAAASAAVLVLAASVPLALASRANVSQLLQGGRTFLFHRRVVATGRAKLGGTLP
ncbi:MAG: ABC transporter permease [Bacillota bacterium]|nr:MAG: ABC transporter permease [Bacillota bacterium]